VGTRITISNHGNQYDDAPASVQLHSRHNFDQR